MRLINAITLQLREFHGDNIPPYAILSHTWGNQEVTFQDWQDQATATAKDGYAKIIGACSMALRGGLEWVWVDTNCIDKTSSAELTEAINSMFTYYRRAEICFAYLSDVPSARSLGRKSLRRRVRKSRWFTRGWTLQELLAPKHLLFYAADWSRIGRRDAPSLANWASQATGIEESYLNGLEPVDGACISKRMSWLAKRTTTRVEDMAYCMLGIFDINMPLLYGEGTKAFTRLQHEIIRTTNDHTIFCWTWTDSVPTNWASLLAPSAAQFENTGVFSRQESHSGLQEISIFSMTNAGLSIRLPVMYTMNSYFVVLQAGLATKLISDPVSSCIQVRGQVRGNLLHVSRVPYPPRPASISIDSSRSLNMKSLLVMNRLATGQLVTANHWIEATSHPREATFLLTFHSAALLERFNIPQDSDGIQPGLDSFLSTIKVELKPETVDKAVGVALTHAWTETPEGGTTSVYIVAGIKVHKGHTQVFGEISQIGRKTLSARRREELLYDLYRFLSRTEEIVKGHYYKELQISIWAEDANNVSEPGGNFYFLHFGDDEGLYSRYAPTLSHEERARWASDNDDSDTGSDIAIIRLN